MDVYAFGVDTALLLLHVWRLLLEHAIYYYWPLINDQQVCIPSTDCPCEYYKTYMLMYVYI